MPELDAATKVMPMKVENTNNKPARKARTTVRRSSEHKAKLQLASSVLAKEMDKKRNTDDHRIFIF